MSESNVSQWINGSWPFTQKLWRENDLSLYERSVLMTIIGRVGRNKAAYPSQERIAKDLSISVRQVGRAINALAVRGFITKTRRSPGGVNNYVINVSALASWSEEPSDSQSEPIPHLQPVRPNPSDSQAEPLGLPVREKGITRKDSSKEVCLAPKRPSPGKNKTFLWATEDELDSLREKWIGRIPDYDDVLFDCREYSTFGDKKTESGTIEGWMRMHIKFEEERKAKQGINGNGSPSRPSGQQLPQNRLNKPGLPDWLTKAERERMSKGLPLEEVPTT